MVGQVRWPVTHTYIVTSAGWLAMEIVTEHTVNATYDNVDDNTSNSPAWGILGLEVARMHLFFSFTLDGVKYPCALVHWFFCTTETLSDITGMHAVEPDCLPDDQPVTAVVHLSSLHGGTSSTHLFKPSSCVKTSTP